MVCRQADCAGEIVTLSNEDRVCNECGTVVEESVVIDDGFSAHLFTAKTKTGTHQTLGRKRVRDDHLQFTVSQTQHWKKLLQVANHFQFTSAIITQSKTLFAQAAHCASQPQPPPQSESKEGKKKDVHYSVFMGSYAELAACCFLHVSKRYKLAISKDEMIRVADVTPRRFNRAWVELLKIKPLQQQQQQTVDVFYTATTTPTKTTTTSEHITRAAQILLSEQCQHRALVQTTANQIVQLAHVDALDTGRRPFSTAVAAVWLAIEANRRHCVGINRTTIASASNITKVWVLSARISEMKLQALELAHSAGIPDVTSKNVVAEHLLDILRHQTSLVSLRQLRPHCDVGACSTQPLTDNSNSYCSYSSYSRCSYSSSSGGGKHASSKVVQLKPASFKASVLKREREQDMSRKRLCLQHAIAINRKQQRNNININSVRNNNNNNNNNNNDNYKHNNNHSNNYQHSNNNNNADNYHNTNNNNHHHDHRHHHHNSHYQYNDDDYYNNNNRNNCNNNSTTTTTIADDNDHHHHHNGNDDDDDDSNIKSGSWPMPPTSQISATFLANMQMQSTTTTCSLSNTAPLPTTTTTTTVPYDHVDGCMQHQAVAMDVVNMKTATVNTKTDTVNTKTINAMVTLLSDGWHPQRVFNADIDLLLKASTEKRSQHDHDDDDDDDDDDEELHESTLERDIPNGFDEFIKSAQEIEQCTW